MDIPHVIAGLIVLLGGFVQGASGFGFGLTTMGFLPFAIDTREAVIVVAILTPLVSGMLMVRLRGHLSLRRSLPYLAGGFPGLCLGVLIFVHAGTGLLKMMIGATLVLFCGFLLISRRSFKVKSHWALSVVVGMLAGLIGGATNCGGPPLVLYVYMQGMSKEDTSGTLQLIFFVNGAIKVAMLALAGQIEAGHLEWSAIFVAAMAAGGTAGLVVFRKLDTEKLRRGVYAMLMVVGLSLVVSAARELRSPPPPTPPTPLTPLTPFTPPPPPPPSPTGVETDIDPAGAPR